MAVKGLKHGTITVAFQQRVVRCGSAATAARLVRPQSAAGAADTINRFMSTRLGVSAEEVFVAPAGQYQAQAAVPEQQRDWLERTPTGDSLAERSHRRPPPRRSAAESRHCKPRSRHDNVHDQAYHHSPRLLFSILINK